MSRIFRATLVASALCLAPLSASGLERLCDTAFEDCRQPLLDLIENEPGINDPQGRPVGAIDVAFWFMEDARYSAALARAAARGVPIRVIFDTEALPADSSRQFVAAQIADAGIPMREKVDPGINHWKMMIFKHQQTVQFSGANHTDEAFVPAVPYISYVDEVIYFTGRTSIVKSFMRKFDDVWTSTTGMMANYANVGALVRRYPELADYPIDPELNFPPFDSFRDRSMRAYRDERTRVDAIIYRITDQHHTNTLIENLEERGVPTRLITEPFQYRDESRLWHAWNVDRLYKAGQQRWIGGRPGIEVRHRYHDGLLHEKLSIMVGQGMSVIGSSNWTSPSSDYQLEHNLFTTDPATYAWSRAHFDRKWNNTGPAPETQEFVPLPPDRPSLRAPEHNATAQPLTVTLEWYAGPWAHKYDVFIGTDPTNLVRVVHDDPRGPYFLSHTVSGLTAGTRYYWRVISRTMADVEAMGDVWSFVTQGTAPSNAPPTVSLTAPTNGAGYTAPATITLSASASDSDGSVVRVDFLAGTTVVASASSAPFTATWSSVPAGSYTVAARAVDNLGAATTSAAIGVTVVPGASNLPAPWNDGDIGSVALAGGASVSGATWTVTGAGSDVWGTADEFHFAYRQLTGDGSITARVTTVQNVDEWTKAGVMIRETLTPGSPHGFMFLTPGTQKGLAFQRRTTANGASSHTGAGNGAPPAWVRLTRVGQAITAYLSADGSTWTVVGTDTIPMAGTVYVGLAVTSHVPGTLASATFTDVTVATGTTPPPNTPPTVTLTAPANGASFTAPASITVSANAADSDGSVARVEFYAGASLIGTDTGAPYAVSWSNVAAGTYVLTARAFDNAGASTTSGSATVQVTSPTPGGGLPAGWSSGDIGAVGASGGAEFLDGVFTLRGSGADIWGTSDAFHFAYRTLTGDGTITARITSIENVDRWTKTGVMIRASLTPGSPHAMMIGSPSRGFAFQRRLLQDGESVSTAGPLVTAPYWVRLERTGSTIKASTSPDGVIWTLVGEDVLTFPGTVFVGLPLTSHNSGVVATGTLDNVTVTP